MKSSLEYIMCLINVVSVSCAHTPSLPPTDHAVGGIQVRAAVRHEDLGDHKTGA